MSILNKIYLSNLENNFRIEAEFYKPQDLSLISKVTSGSFSNLLSLTIKITDGSHFTPRYVHFGKPFLSAVNIKENYLDFGEGYKNVSTNEFANLLKRCDPKPLDILLRKVGVGPRWACVIPQGISDFTIFVSVALLKIDPLKIDPYYLSTFINCKYGQVQLLRLNKGISQPDLHLEDIRLLKVPLPSRPFQIRISEFVKTSNLKLEGAKSHYSQAQSLLEKELGMDKISLPKNLFSITNLNDILSYKRNDAEFYNPELKFYLSFLNQNFTLTPLTTYSDVLKFSNPSYAITGIPIITQKHLSKISPTGYLDGIFTDDSWLRTNKAALLSKHDLLFYSVGAYLGKTNIWLNDDSAVPASFITLLRAYNYYDAGYLFVLLNSKFGLLQSKVWQSGTSQQYIYPKDIKRFLIPDVSIDLRKELFKMIFDSYNNLNKSKQLLTSAIKQVEDLIESEAAKN